MEPKGANILDTLSSTLANWQEPLTAWATVHVFAWIVLWQALGLGVAVVVIYFLARPLRPALTRWVSGLQPSSRTKRLAQAALAQLAVILFLMQIWLVVAVLSQFDLAEDNDLLVVVASIMTAWVLIKLTSSLIANRLVAKLIFLFAWSAAVLNILGVLDEAIDALYSQTIPLGETSLPLATIISGALLFGALLWTALAISRLVQNQIGTHDEISPRAQVLLGKAVRFSMVAVAVIVALTSMGINFAALAVFTGALGVGIGIGLQQQVSNLLSGLFLLLDKSVKPGDVIEVGETFGWVKDMRARYVGVITRENKELLIPNDDFVNNQVTNWSHSDDDVRMEVRFGVSYDSDPHFVRRLAVQAAASADPRIITYKKPMCHLVEYGDSSVNFTLRFWIEDPQNGVTNIKGLVLLALWDRLQEHGIDIPYPHRQLILEHRDAAI